MNEEDNVEDFYTIDFNTYFTVVTKNDNKIRIYDERGTNVAEIERTEVLEESHVFFLNDNCLLVQYGPYSERKEDLSKDFGEYLIDYDGKTISKVYSGIYLKQGTEYLFGKYLQTPDTIDIMDKKGHLIETIENAYFELIPEKFNTRTFDDDILCWDSENDPDENYAYLWTIEGRESINTKDAPSNKNKDKNSEILPDSWIKDNNSLYSFELNEDENKIVVRTIDGALYSETDFICDQSCIYLDDDMLDF